jgi:hypothetical protein
VAPLQEFVEGELEQSAEVRLDRLLHGVAHGRWVAVGSARRLGQDLVDHAQAQQVRGGHLERLRRVRRLLRIVPEDRRATLGGDDRIDRVLEHQHPVRHADRQGPAAAAFPDDDGHDRDLERRHHHEVAGDGFGLAALLGAEAGIGAGRIDEGDDRLVESLG